RIVRLLLSYLVDWIVTLVLLLLFMLMYLLTPFQRPFSVEDKSISYPYKVYDTISEPMLAVITVVYGALIPFLIILFISIIIRKSPHDLHHGSLGLFLAISLTLVLIISFKFTIGRHRPDFLARCMPKLPEGLTTDPRFSLFDATICTQPDQSIIKEGQRSFTSGHAAVSFCGLTYLSLYLAGKLHVFDRKGHTYKTFIVILPMLGALFISITRIQDFRHHWSDVLVGGIIGIVLSYFSYHQYYPSIVDRYSQIPYSPRIKKDKDNTT
ncbi:PAP2-domain-containing protein, partial [Neoconidiobolus thromboides FSU 785]